MIPRIALFGTVFTGLIQASFYLERRWHIQGKAHLETVCILLIEQGSGQFSDAVLQFFEHHYPRVDFSSVHDELQYHKEL